MFYVLFLVFSEATAQQIGDSTYQAISPAKLKKAYVKSVVNIKSLKSEAGLGDYIKVEIANIDLLLQTAAEREQKIILLKLVEKFV